MALLVEGLTARKHDSEPAGVWARYQDMSESRRAIRGLIPSKWPTRPSAAVVIAAILTALTLPVFSLAPPGPGLDASWFAGLHMAAHSGMNFGSEINFVFGPLGFLAFPLLFYASTAMLAFAAVTAVYFVSLLLVARHLIPRLGVPVAAALTLAIAVVTRPLELPERLEAVFIVLCGELALNAERPLTERSAAALGALAAAMALIKLSSGTVALALLGITLLLPFTATPSSRRQGVRVAGMGLSAYAIVLIALWLASRQALADLPRYIRQAVDLVVGNGSAVALEAPKRGWEYVAAAVALALLAVLLWRAARSLSYRRRSLAFALFAVFFFFSFRHGFVRHDGHSLSFFAPALIALVVLVGPGRLQLAAAAGIVLAVGSMSMRDPLDLLRIGTDPAVDGIANLVSTGRRVGVQENARSSIRAAYGLPPTVVERLRGETVHVDPWDAELVWAYPEFRWRPVPAFQAFTAYTRYLDELNVDSLTSRTAPRFVLRTPVASDDRNPRFESPGYVLALLCRYREVAITHGTVNPGFQVLERGSDRCGTPVGLGSRRVPFGKRVAVPKASRNEMLVARFEDFQDPLPQTLAAVAFKREVVHVAVGGRVYRFLTGHAGSLHLMRAPRCLGYGPLFDSKPYASVAIGREAAGLLKGPTAEAGSYSVSFFRVSFRCTRGA
jgi:hypothetical protein